MMVPMAVPVAQILSTVVPVLGFVVALVLLIKGARGSFRVTGIIGAALLTLGMISGFVYRWVVDPILTGRDDATVISVLAVQSVVGSVLTGAGLILFSYAIIAAGRVQKA